MNQKKFETSWWRNDHKDQRSNLQKGNIKIDSCFLEYLPPRDLKIWFYLFVFILKSRGFENSFFLFFSRFSSWLIFKIWASVISLILKAFFFLSFFIYPFCFLLLLARSRYNFGWPYLLFSKSWEFEISSSLSLSFVFGICAFLRGYMGHGTLESMMLFVVSLVIC